MNLNKVQNSDYKKKSMIITSLFLLIFFALFYFIILPTIDSVKKLRLEILAQKIEIEKSINKEKNKSVLGAKLKKIEPQLEEFNTIFVNKDKNLEFITTLEGIADKHKVDQAIILNTNPYSNKNLYSVIPVTLNITGRFENAIQYLHSLESLGYYIKITSFSLNKTESVDTDVYVNLNITADSYWK